ncbi:MBL fold metallo-hydrolase RNA specificity domain-containing protein [Oryzobacter terrae]|uniref:MBL fold metallo-hydrolase RNA specificity domain-containing protein n=1 Tax=Oryzobacter terrae TaxID=1620385 RepID=UPI00366D0DDD
MTTTLTFLGAAGTVTGSKFLVEDGTSRLLVDCGLYQGERRWRRLNWEPPPVPAAELDDVVLTHAHLDHCGYLPALARHGYGGPVWATHGTAELAGIVLRDSAHLQEEDAVHAAAGRWSRHDPPLPLYDAVDAERAIDLLRSRAFTVAFDLAGGGSVTFDRAGHVLGSATALVEVGGSSILFSGDLGRPAHPLLRPRARPPAARTVVLESTYGDRTHPASDGLHTALGAAVTRTIERGGSVVIPAFAIDRTELVLLALARLRAAGSIPDVPVYVDSPMALRALDVYSRPEARSELAGSGLDELSVLRQLRTAHTAEESRALNNPGAPCVIVSASGMASGGRVVHHLRQLLPGRRNCVVLTGYQAVGTRGRDLLEGARQVKIMGEYVRVRAEVVSDDEFSVHADADELLRWLLEMPTPPRTVYLVHGEPDAAAALAERVRAALDCVVVVPRLGERVVADEGRTGT